MGISSKTDIKGLRCCRDCEMMILISDHRFTRDLSVIKFEMSNKISVVFINTETNRAFHHSQTCLPTTLNQLRHVKPPPRSQLGSVKGFQGTVPVFVLLSNRKTNVLPRGQPTGQKRRHQTWMKSLHQWLHFLQQVIVLLDHGLLSLTSTPGQ